MKLPNFSNNRNSFHTAVAVLGALACATPVAAATSGYVGLSIGQTTAQVESNDICPFFGDIQCNIDDSDTGIKLFAGTKFTNNIALEGGYVDLGEVTMTGVDSFFGNIRTTTKASALFVAVRGIIPLGPDVELFGKAGAHLWSAEWSLASTSGFDSDDADGTGFLFGFGGAVSFSDFVQVRGEWERFADIGDLASTDEGDFDLLSIGILLNF